MAYLTGRSPPIKGLLIKFVHSVDRNRNGVDRTSLPVRCAVCTTQSVHSHREGGHSHRYVQNAIAEADIPDVVSEKEWGDYAIRWSIYRTRSVQANPSQVCKLRDTPAEYSLVYSLIWTENCTCNGRPMAHSCKSNPGAARAPGLSAGVRTVVCRGLNIETINIDPERLEVVVVSVTPLPARQHAVHVWRSS
jgi:hypothetical protein